MAVLCSAPLLMSLRGLPELNWDRIDKVCEREKSKSTQAHNFSYISHSVISHNVQKKKEKKRVIKIRSWQNDKS